MGSATVAPRRIAGSGVLARASRGRDADFLQPGVIHAEAVEPPRAGRRAYVVGYVYLVASSAAAKVAGLVREIVIAALFGTNPALGLYVLLRSGVEALSVTATGAFHLNLVPRLSRLAARESAGLDPRALFLDAIRIGAGAALVSLVGTAAALVLTETSVSLALVLLLSLSVGMLLVGALGLIGMQAKGQFGRMSAVYLMTALLMAAIVYPLGRWLGVVGLALAWLVSVTVQAAIVWAATLREAFNRPPAVWRRPSILRRSDFSPSVLVAGNQMVLCLVAMRLLAGWESLQMVAIVNYALVVAGLFVTTIAKTMSSVVLKAAADGLTWARLQQAIALQVLASAAVYVSLAWFGEAAIGFAFERGSFDAASTAAVHHFLMRVFPAVALLGPLDLLVVYANGRGLAVAPRMYGMIAAAMIAAFAGASGLAAWGGQMQTAPLVFAGSFAVTALFASALLVRRAAGESRP